MDTYYKALNESMVNHLPFSNHLIDLMTQKSSINPINLTFTIDRYKAASNALSLNYGSLNLPSGIYFDGDFTLSIWVKVRSVSPRTKILDFNSIDQKDYISLYLSNSTYFVPYVTIRSNNVFKLESKL